MSDFTRFQTRQTLRAAGLPTDLNAIVGGNLVYRRGCGECGLFRVIGVDFGIERVTIHLDSPSRIFAHRAVLVFELGLHWEGWFHGRIDPEWLVEVRLL